MKIIHLRAGLLKENMYIQYFSFNFTANTLFFLGLNFQTFAVVVNLGCASKTQELFTLSRDSIFPNIYSGWIFRKKISLKGQVWLLFHIEFQKSSIRSTHFGYYINCLFQICSLILQKKKFKWKENWAHLSMWMLHGKQVSKQSEKEIQSAIKTDVTGQCTK